MARIKFNTTLEEKLVLELKKLALIERKGANDILEELLKEKFNEIKIKGE